MYKAGKRIFDIIMSGIAIIILLPLWMAAIIGIEISDPGPVFYVADRTGKDNRLFRMYKFRSMSVDSCADEKSLRPSQDRIYGWGRIMRRAKIDELPQLLNILRGDMSVIGPRPAATDQIEITRGGSNAVIAELVPGLSGPSALYDYIYGDKFEDEEEYIEKVLPTRLKLDLYYYREKGIAYDLKVLWQTVICVLFTLTGKEPVRIFNELTEAAKTIE